MNRSIIIRKNIKESLALLCLMILMVSMAACGKSEEKTIVGTWSGTDDNGIQYTYVLNEDGTGNYIIVYDEETTDERQFEWKEENEKLVLKVTYLSIVDEESYSYTFDQDTLSISRRRINVTLSRQK